MTLRKKDFFKLMNNSLFVKTIKNVQKHRDIKIVTKISYYKVFLRKSFEKNQVLTNKPFYLVLSTLHLSKTVMYEFCMIMETKIMAQGQKFVTWILFYLNILLQFHCPCENK